MTTFADLAANVEGCRTEATASAGVATSQDGKQSLEEMLSAADRALYEGKRRGRDSLRAPRRCRAVDCPFPRIIESRARNPRELASSAMDELQADDPADLRSRRKGHRWAAIAKRQD